MLNKIFFLILFFLLQLTSSAQDFLAGAATRTINPEKDSLYLAGGKANRLFIDVHDNLYVKAVVLSNSNNNLTELKLKWNFPPLMQNILLCHLPIPMQVQM